MNGPTPVVEFLSGMVWCWGAIGLWASPAFLPAIWGSQPED